ncbi:hypothetical protein Dimus_015048 [Dionaea muscipula]
MSLSYADCIPDLLCDEDSQNVLSGYPSESSSILESASATAAACCFEESIAKLMEKEMIHNRCCDFSSQPRSYSLVPSARSQSIAWMLKVREFYGFRALTALLSVNYFDRFFVSHSLPPHTNGWPLQLLSVACLSLAAKMEEPLVPSLGDLQVEGAKYLFQSKTIQRMELLVLGALDWRLRTITPFSYIRFFACKVDPAGSYVGFLLCRAEDHILTILQESSYVEQRPSSVAAAAILRAASEIPNLSSVVTTEQFESWCDGLNKDKVFECYRLMQQQCVVEARKPPKVLPSSTPLTLITRTRTMTSTSTTRVKCNMEKFWFLLLIWLRAKACEVVLLLCGRCRLTLDSSSMT